MRRQSDLEACLIRDLALPRTYALLSPAVLPSDPKKTSYQRKTEPLTEMSTHFYLLSGQCFLSPYASNFGHDCGIEASSISARALLLVLLAL